MTGNLKQDPDSMSDGERDALLKYAEARMDVKRVTDRLLALMHACFHLCQQVDKTLDAAAKGGHPKKVWKQYKSLLELGTEAECIIMLNFLSPPVDYLPKELMAKLRDVVHPAQLDDIALDKLQNVLSNALSKSQEEYNFMAKNNEHRPGPGELKLAYYRRFVEKAMKSHLKSIGDHDGNQVKVEHVTPEQARKIISKINDVTK